MDKTPLVDLFERTDFNNIKKLDSPLFPGLFDRVSSWMFRKTDAEITR